MSSTSSVMVKIVDDVFVEIPRGHGIEIVHDEQSVVSSMVMLHLPQVALDPPRRYVGHWTFWTGSRWARGERVTPGTTVRCRRDDGMTYDVLLS